MVDILVLLVLWLHEAGKAGTHAVRGVAPLSRARRPLIRGLAITDAYHAMSGVQWLAPLGVAWMQWGLPWGDGWGWWAAYIAGAGLIWPASKLWKGLTVRAAVRECWWWQIGRWLTRGGRR